MFDEIHSKESGASKVYSSPRLIEDVIELGNGMKIKCPPKHDLTEDEKKAIDERLKREGKNQYGDPEGTMYPGGNPYFYSPYRVCDLDRYDFLLIPRMTIDKPNRSSSDTK
jgi:hypothetical protein